MKYNIPNKKWKRQLISVSVKWSVHILLICVFILLFGTKSVKSQSFKIIAKSNPQITTHQLTSGKLTIGITENGGGVINQILIPGIGDIMDVKSDMYGRCGQSSIRSMAHGGKYNPTQAGFNETLGTLSPIIQTKNKLVVVPRGCALWKADGKYDYTEWENIGSDSYNEVTKYSGVQGHSDQDGLDESDLPGRQEAEVFSEFDYYGTYENCVGKYGIKTATIRHYFEYRFIREPGHCLNQFNKETLMWNDKQVVDDISVKCPKGKFKGTDKDMNHCNTAWSIRNDLAKWNPKYRYVQKVDGTWEVQERNKTFKGCSDSYNQLFIISDSPDIDSGNALCLYRPNTDINRYSIIGVNEADGSIAYKDNRTCQEFINESPHRTTTMSWMGFKHSILGIINRNRLPHGIYEAYRAEYYILFGTPKEIMDAIEAINKK